MRWFPIALVVVANVLYHLGQKSVPRDAHPVVAALGMYVVAAVAGLLLIPVLQPLPTRASASAAIHWSVALAGLAILGIEIGFLVAYRNGWQISAAALTAMTAVAIVLLPIGVFAYREALSPTRLVGFGLCLIGLWLMSRR